MSRRRTADARDQSRRTRAARAAAEKAEAPNPTGEHAFCRPIDGGPQVSFADKQAAWLRGMQDVQGRSHALYVLAMSDKDLYPDRHRTEVEAWWQNTRALHAALRSR